MPKTIQKNPPAGRLINSLRGIGYNFSTSLADIIDNSISAKAKKIDIYYETFSEPFVEIIDDGIGMSEDELINALTFGSEKIYESEDLGRFGLGLKSASLSQCRKLQVCTKQNDKICCMGYELDLIDSTNQWVISCYDEDEMNSIPNIEKLKTMKTGTIVKWEDFEFIKLESQGDKYLENLRKKIMLAKEHIELVFHRFYDEIVITFNDNRIEKRDPFLLNSKPRQQTGYLTPICDKNGEITVIDYVLPYENSLTEKEKRLLGIFNSKKSLYDDQGFYIYRNKRLIIWGDWLRMNAKNEFSKLARIQLDIPASMDSIWKLDVKKSSANIPESIRNKIKIALKNSINGSSNVIKRPGKVEKNSKNGIWLRREFDKEGISYELNKENEFYKELQCRISDEAKLYLKAYLYEIEKNLPKFQIKDDLLENKNVINKTSESIDELKEEFINMVRQNDIELREKVMMLLINNEHFKELLSDIEDIKKRVLIDG